MHIVILAPPDQPVSPTIGGSVQICIYQIAKRLAHSHQITVISRQFKGFPDESHEDGIRILRIPSSVRDYVYKAIQAIRSLNYDYIQVENRPHYIPVLRQHFPDAKIVLVLHSIIFMGYLSRSRQLDVIRNSSAIICNSHFLRKYYSKRFPSFSNRFYTIHLGADLSRFRKPTPEEKRLVQNRYGIKRKRFTLLYAGRIFPKKGIHITIKAAGILRKKYPFIQVVIAGPTMVKGYRVKLIQLARRLNVPVRFLGVIRPSNMHQFYWLGDCFVLPHQGHEAFGLVNVEAMASGIPVVASRSGGIVEIIKNGKNGILVHNKRNPHLYAKAIEKLIQSPSLVKALTYAGKKTVHQMFSWEETAKRYDQFYLWFARS